jgi:hypothetical protein
MSMRYRFPICPLCNETVELTTSATDQDGMAVHQHCYTHALTLKTPTPDGTTPNQSH